MGILFTRMLSSHFGNREVQIVVLGLDNARKTTILYRLQMGEVVSTVPTIGFNVETVQHNNIKLQVWDLGYRDLKLWMFDLKMLSQAQCFRSFT
ncbi:hypothetical protein COCNU_06G016930 [Cocos nucifera]|uniref:ADP-ribosylation factor n=1 Tax=Cocos nucifera TaxID=13894 RepID=A0A8K0ICQ8_COCNU|nr:hypothetical protein COCNU_06G016930 [Cocos nucifera]